MKGASIRPVVVRVAGGNAAMQNRHAGHKETWQRSSNEFGHHRGDLGAIENEKLAGIPAFILARRGPSGFAGAAGCRMSGRMELDGDV
jgi:hypothetical protein